MEVLKHFINGKLTEGNPIANGPVFNPATGEKTKEVLFASRMDVNLAVHAAAAAFPKWSNTTPLHRARIFFKFKELLNKHSQQIIKLITDEHGKVLDDALGELTRGIEIVDFVCGIPHLLKGEYAGNVGTCIDCYSTRQPRGVCAGITPFNFPAMAPMWMFPVAIACGNTFVLKPSEKVPSASIFLAKLLQEAGLPDGVFNVINGDKTAVDEILNHQQVVAISFVGSTPVANHVYTTGTNNLKAVQALGGAKNHCLVLPDANLDQTANSIVGGAYGSAGERCMALSVAVVVGEKIADELITKLCDRIAKLNTAPGVDPLAEMGPLVTKQHLEKVLSYIELGLKEGANLVADGRTLKIQNHEKGFFLGPCLFDMVQPWMKIYQEEIFGPVLCIVRVKNYDSALQLINQHKFANGSVIFTNDGGVARYFADKVQAGMVGINAPLPVPTAFYSFGGWKDSRYGDHAIYGIEGIRFYTKLKTVTVRWPRENLSQPEYVMPTMN